MLRYLILGVCVPYARGGMLGGLNNLPADEAECIDGDVAADADADADADSADVESAEAAPADADGKKNQ
jgi:hypothetical protein